MSFLSFEPAGTSESGKTKLWDVKSASGGNPLGRVGWYAPWRKYTFAPYGSTVFDATCLSAISEFLLLETVRHKTK